VHLQQPHELTEHVGRVDVVVKGGVQGVAQRKQVFVLGG
jgi:hypothetical protein